MLAGERKGPHPARSGLSGLVLRLNTGHSSANESSWNASNAELHAVRQTDHAGFEQFRLKKGQRMSLPYVLELRLPYPQTRGATTSRNTSIEPVFDVYIDTAWTAAAQSASRFAGPRIGDVKRQGAM
ncbi:hypothetical protein C8R31_101711 [Nitrosospira sp. Nsp2]|nr:hypothetical protein C8R31_101711 [Nitrosospira sp. Nsp2]